MPEVAPAVIIRMGTHAEKEYLEKTLHFFDGLILGANLVEATPGATASLLVKFGGKKASQRFFIDPMTYAFSPYVDESDRVRLDLDWIKSDQKRTVRPCATSSDHIVGWPRRWASHFRLPCPVSRP